MSKFKLGDMFLSAEGQLFHYMKINSQGEPEKHSDYPFRLESMKGIGFWDAYKTQEEAEEELGELVSTGYLTHYTNWSVVLRSMESSMKIVSRVDLD